MFEAFLKQLKVNGSGEYTVCRIAAETAEALAVKRDVYIADDWQDSSEAEYTAQFAARTAPIDSEADKALGGEVTETEPTPSVETPVESEAPIETTPAPES